MFVQLVVVLVLMIPILAILLDSPVGKAIAARLEGRALPSGDDVVTDRMAFLEGEVDRLATELRRLDDESQFLHKLLAERPKPDVLPPGDDHA